MRPEDALRAINEARADALVVPTMTAVPEWRTIAPANYMHVLFANGVYQTSGSQGIPASGSVDFAGMTEAAGYAFTTRIDTLEELRIRLPELLSVRGPVLVELAVEEAELTPMTAPGGDPLRVQVERLRERLASGG